MLSLWRWPVPAEQSEYDRVCGNPGGPRERFGARSTNFGSGPEPFVAGIVKRLGVNDGRTPFAEKFDGDG